MREFADQLPRTPALVAHAATAAEVAEALDVDPARGLSEEEARARLAEIGPNRLTVRAAPSLWHELGEELREPMIVLLLATGVLYSVWGELRDAATIFVVILALVGIEVGNEVRATRAIAALRDLAEPRALARRDGRASEVDAATLVPGDVVVLAPGRRVPADARLVSADGLAADEASLTGESLPVDKDPAAILPRIAALADRRNLVFAGTLVARGRGEAITVATGRATELGRVAELAETVRPPRTQLQLAMNDLVRWMVVMAIAFSLLVPVLGSLVSGQPFRVMVLTGLSLAFATIPEELPIIITMVLALGGYRLARRNAIVRRLQAVETLGAVTVIGTDKTGTLTENRMAVTVVEPAEQRERVLRIALLCAEPTTEGEPGTDPFDLAVADAATAAGIDGGRVRSSYTLVRRFAFDPLRKRTSVVALDEGGAWGFVVGAPEVLLERSIARASGDRARPFAAGDRGEALLAAEELAGRGLRVLAAAEKALASGEASEREAEEGLTFVGLVAFEDPPRAGAAEAIAAARAAGIRPVMITGDHPLTALEIARRVGIAADGRVLSGAELDRLTDDELAASVGELDVIARATPEHKLRLVRAWQSGAEIVAVTGDGVNDAPALAAADIGVAMGHRGTDVAREAADVVLADDDVGTIERAVEEGRVLFANLRKGVRYYLACKVALVSASLVAVLAGVGVPFAPVQIILMELFMDLAASAAFVAEGPEEALMRVPPRDPTRRFLDRPMATSILVAAAGLFAAVSVAYLAAHAVADPRTARTVAFVTWLLGHFFLALNLRSEREPLSRLGPFSNRVMSAWGAATVAFVLLAVLVPGLRGPLRTAPLTPGLWALAVAAAGLGTWWLEVRKRLVGWRSGR